MVTGRASIVNYDTAHFQEMSVSQPGEKRSWLFQASIYQTCGEYLPVLRSIVWVVLVYASSSRTTGYTGTQETLSTQHLQGSQGVYDCLSAGRRPDGSWAPYVADKTTTVGSYRYATAGTIVLRTFCYSTWYNEIRYNCTGSLLSKYQQTLNILKKQFLGLYIFLKPEKIFVLN